MFKGRADGAPFSKVLKKGVCKIIMILKRAQKDKSPEKHNGLLNKSSTKPRQPQVYSEYFSPKKPFPAKYLSLKNDLGAKK